MSTLHVRNFPEPLYEVLRRRSVQRATSISAEAIRLLSRAVQLEPDNIRDLIAEIRAHRPTARPGSPSAAQLIREDRDSR